MIGAYIASDGYGLGYSYFVRPVTVALDSVDCSGCNLHDLEFKYCVDT